MQRAGTVALYSDSSILKIMKTKNLLLGVIIIVIVGIFLFLGNSGKEPDSAGDSSGLIISTNAIYAAEQAPGQEFSVAVVYLEKPGFVVVHEDNAGKPGQILSASALLPAGENKNTPPIALPRATKDGETLYAMLHLDNGDGQFDAVKDKPAQDKVGGVPVMMIIGVSQGATEPGAINL